MRPFAYARTDSPSVAVATLAHEPDAAFLAGGTSLVDLIKIGAAAPTALLDIGGLPLRAIGVRADGTLAIGALATMNDTAEDAHVRELAPVVAQALAQSASPQLRNMATIGGNVMQRTRCAYFRDTATPCNKRAPGTGCTAIDGDNRRHAILGASPSCICTHPSDFATALLVTNASLRVRGPRGTRTIPFGDVHLLPGATPWRDTSLAHGELIEAVELHPDAASRNSTYLKIRDRASFEFALVSVALALDVAGGTVREARVAFGGVAPVPWRAHAAEAALRGKPLTRDALAAAADAELAAAKPQKLNGFKVALVKRAFVRAATTLGGVA